MQIYIIIIIISSSTLRVYSNQHRLQEAKLTDR